MKMEDVDPFEECFTHISEKDGHQTTWAAGALFRFCEANPDKVERTLIPVEQHHAHFCLTQRGVEKDRLRVLVEHPEYQAKPILFVVMPDGAYLLVDGTHRYVVAFGALDPDIDAYLVPYAVAEPFIIEGLPQTSVEAVMSPSHITLLRSLGLM